MDRGACIEGAPDRLVAAVAGQGGAPTGRHVERASVLGSARLEQHDSRLQLPQAFAPAAHRLVPKRRCLPCGHVVNVPQNHGVDVQNEHGIEADERQRVQLGKAASMPALRPRRGLHGWQVQNPHAESSEQTLVLLAPLARQVQVDGQRRFDAAQAQHEPDHEHRIPQILAQRHLSVEVAHVSGIVRVDNCNRKG